MRVSVSLSDRERHDWRDSAACRDMDPRDFDDGGTPVAWEACRGCDVLDECLQDARDSSDPVWGVYRAGRSWGSKPHGFETRHCEKCDRQLLRVRSENGLLIFVDKLCLACRDAAKPRVSLEKRIHEWNTHAREGVSLGRAAALMGIERHTLVSYRRDARRRGMTVLEPVDGGLSNIRSASPNGHQEQHREGA